jgi:hypothetical protein
VVILDARMSMVVAPHSRVPPICIVTTVPYVRRRYEIVHGLVVSGKAIGAFHGGIISLCTVGEFTTRSLRQELIKLNMVH